jgi:hypothetical protein
VKGIFSQYCVSLDLFFVTFFCIKTKESKAEAGYQDKERRDE